jgi:hypothetical protein
LNQNAQRPDTSHVRRGLLPSHAFLLKRALLLLWTGWLTLVFTTNVLDACKAMGLLPETWAFASDNFDFMLRTTARYGTPKWINAVLFGGVIAWEGAAVALFWQACFRFRDKCKGMPTVYLAFTVSLPLWLSFLIADEIFVSYPLEATHMGIFIGQLLTLLAIELLPEGPTTASP